MYGERVFALSLSFVFVSTHQFILHILYVLGSPLYFSQRSSWKTELIFRGYIYIYIYSLTNYANSNLSASYCTYSAVGNTAVSVSVPLNGKFNTNLLLPTFSHSVENVNFFATW
jgi:hypothetical protein